MNNNNSWLDLIIIIIGGSISLFVLFALSEVDGIAIVFRFIFFFLLWLLSLYGCIFSNFKSSNPTDMKDWKNFSIQHEWPELMARLIGAIFWTIAIYYAAFYGVGLEKDPYIG